MGTLHQQHNMITRSCTITAFAVLLAHWAGNKVPDQKDGRKSALLAPFTACKDLTEGAACSFTLPDRTVTDTCRSVRDKLACGTPPPRPDHHKDDKKGDWGDKDMPRGKGSHKGKARTAAFEACKELTEGASCSYTADLPKDAPAIDGTCTSTEHDKLVCEPVVCADCGGPGPWYDDDEPEDDDGHFWEILTVMVVVVMAVSVGLCIGLYVGRTRCGEASQPVEVTQNVIATEGVQMKVLGAPTSENPIVAASLPGQPVLATKVVISAPEHDIEKGDST